MNKRNQIADYLASFGRHLRLLQRRLFARSGHSKRGQGLVEFALVLPVLLLLVLGIIEFSYFFTVYTGVFNAAREGVRYGVTQPRDVAGITLSAREKIVLVNPNAAGIAVAYDSGPDTDVFTDTERIAVGASRVLVQVTYDIPTLTPVIQPFAPTFHIETQSARTVASLGDKESLGAMGWGDFDPGGDGDGGGDGGGEGGGGGGGAGPALTLSLEANPATVHSGGTVLLTYTVENTGDEDLYDVVITDSFGNTFEIGFLEAGATAVRTVSVVVTETTTNIVTAAGATEAGEPVSTAESIQVTVIDSALILTVQVEPQQLLSGEEATFTYAVENTGDVGLTYVTVVDSFGVTFSTPSLAAGQTAFWQPAYFIYETTTNDVTARADDPLDEVVTDSASASVVVLEVVPIVITEPLIADQTVVNGTAQTNTSVFIYDPEDPDVSGTYNLTGGQTEFSFPVPPLQPNHVIIVSGYGQWDSAVVQGEFAPIEIQATLCHGDTVVAGTAQPGQSVDLSIAAIGYTDRTTVEEDGTFSFTLFGGITVQADQSVVVSGYEQSDSVTVTWCGGSSAYIAISPQCGAVSPPDITITVNGNNWPTHSNKRKIKIYWDGALQTEFLSQNPSFTEDITVSASEGTHTVRAEVWWKCCTLEDWSEATFIAPCPAPNLVITDLELLTTGVISTHQSLQFRATVANVGTMPHNGLFWVDLYTADPTPLPEGTSGFAWGAVSSIDPGETVDVIITVGDGFEEIGSYQAWAKADSLGQVSETDESDNVFGPTSVVVSQEGTETAPPTGTGTIMGETRILLAVEPVPHKRARVWCIDTETGSEVAFATSDENAQYVLSNLPVGTYLVMAETWIDGVRYFGIVLSPIEITDGAIQVANVVMTQ
jgi:uncharacterized repeat protein (TIGR01451 family)